MPAKIPLSLSLGESKEPGRDDDQDEVENEESEQDEGVSPPIVEPDIQRGEEVLSDGVRAIPTSRGIVRVIEVSTERRHELARPSAARLALRRIEHGKLVRLALDLESMELGGDHRAHDTGERVEVIQPRLCPLSDVGIWNRNTAEGHQDRRKERVAQHGDLDGRRDGTDELRESDTEELDEDEDEELESGSVETRGALAESDGVDHQDPVQDGTENGVWDLGNQLGDGECLSRVDTTVVFADEGHPVHDPQRCQLSLDNGGHNAHPETKVPRSAK